ncbi:MAG: transporter substrate-binding domain-containing protein [Hyphomicrobiaceae bacterium]|nr:transporter substrate-binding domain-containing protein [Hyphomicrobiaceae bacterium]
MAVSGDASARPLDEVRASGELRVVVYDDNAPFSWTDASGVVQGVDADLARALAGELGVKANLIARYAGEEVDDDLRSNIWQGPRTGGLVGDVMMHVPMERAFIARNPLVAISNAYYHEKIVLAVQTDAAVPTEPRSMLQPFRAAKLAVQFATVAHYYAMFADDGVYKANINPYLKFETAVAAFRSRENMGLLGRRAQIEAALKGSDGFKLVEPAFDTELRMAWTVGMAVKENSRDTGYAVGNALNALVDRGEVAKIFERHGLTHVPPPVP